MISADPAAVFPGDSEMARRMRSLDWSRTGLGSPAAWPAPLKTAVSICLNSRYPMFVWWGADLVKLYNDAYIPVLGTRHPAALGRHAREVWSEIWEVLGPQAEIVMSEGRATWNDRQLLVMQRNDFVEETYFSWSYSPIFSHSGEVQGVFCACTEDTARVLGERRLLSLHAMATRASESRSAEEACVRGAGAIEENPRDIPVAVVYLRDASSAHARRVAGVRIDGHDDVFPTVIPLQDLAGEAWRDFSKRKPIAAAPWPEPVQRAIVLPIAGSAPDEAAGHLIAGLSPRRPFDTEYRGYLELVAGQLAKAIAEARAYEAEKKRAEGLAQLDRAKTAFFSNVSHEFRTPLTLMLGPLEHALADPGDALDPQQRAELAVVQRNGLRLLKLVNTLLEFSRIEAGRVQAAYEPADLAAVTAELASNFRSACERAGIRLEVDCAPLGEPVYVDRGMWERIVLNLLSNAFKFTLEGSIRISLHRAGGRAVLSVRDTGCGIPEAEQPHLFERFHRVAGSRGRTHEGTGIGLALAQELARLHGGSVSAESREREGSRFTVEVPFGTAHLPAEQVKAAGSPVAAGAGAAAYLGEALSWLPGDEAITESSGVVGTAEPAGSRPRVLVADDNADMREYLRRLLAGRYEIEAHADGERALEAARRNPPQLVLADVMMPRLDGFGLLRALRADERLRTLPIIMLSARAGEEARIEGLQRGADDYVVKPFGARELLARIDAQLEAARMRSDAEKTLRESEERFRNMADNAPVMVWVTGPDGSCSYLSRSWYGFTGQTPETGLGSGWLQAFHPGDRAPVGDAFMAANEKREPFRLEYRLRRADGEYRWAIDAAVPRFESGGRFLGYIGSVIDITERKQAEERLKEADRGKDELMAMLAHELRNPLAAIGLSAEILERTRLKDRRASAALSSIVRQTEQLQRLTDDLLDVARVTFGKLALQKQPLDLLAAAREAASEHAPRAGEAKIEVDGRQDWIDGDPVRVRQMIGNLLENAVRYGGRKVCIRVGVKGARAQVAVEDDGQGIAPEALPRLFKPFEQGEQTLDRAPGGLGLGLALVDRLAALHGGALEARSEGAGKGAVFTVSFPRAAGPRARAAPTHAQRPPAAEPGKRRVLVVEDEADTRDALRILLEMHGHEVSIAGDGAGGLAGLESFRPHVALIDIGLPGMDGYELARRARELPGRERMTLIAITGYGLDKDRQMAADAGFDLHLTKPVTYAQLARAFGGQA
jgi:PAS domain S-box-containing protein